jgi:hypothetical protein
MTVLHARDRHLSSTHHQLSCLEIAGFIYKVALPLFVSHYTNPTSSYLNYTWNAPLLPHLPCLARLEQLLPQSKCVHMCATCFLIPWLICLSDGFNAQPDAIAYTAYMITRAHMTEHGTC